MSEPQKPDERPLSESAMLHLLMETHTDHIYFKDRESRFILINRALARWFGLDDPAQAIGKTDFDFFTIEHASAARADEVRIMETGIPMIGKIEMETWPDGHRTWVSTTKMPLRDDQNRIVGTFGVSRDVTDQHLQAEQLEKAVAELRRTNQRFQQELALAADVMNALAANRPETFPEQSPNPVIRFYYRYSAAEHLSGDFFVVAPYNSKSVLVFLCDVMGHGVSAALVATIMRVWVGQLVRKETSPGLMLSTLNRRIYNLFGRNPDTFRFATAFCGLLDAVDRRLRYAGAGHPAPILFSPRMGGSRLLYDSRSCGPGLGINPHAEYAEFETELAPLTTLLVFSDGLIESPSAPLNSPAPELEIVERLNRYPGMSAPALVDDLFSSACARNAPGLEDDICLVAAEMLH